MTNVLALTTPDPAPSSRASAPALLGLSILLAGEILALTLRFDGETMGDHRAWLGSVIARSHFLISLVVCAAFFVVGVLRVPARDGAVAADPPGTAGGRRRAWSCLAAHLAAYLGLAWLTGRIFEGRVLSSAGAVAWVGLWLAAGAATVGSGMLVVWPWAVWSHLVRRHWRMLAGAGLAAAAAVAIGQWTSTLWLAFHGSTFQAVRGILLLSHGDVVCRPGEFILGTPRFQGEITAACSGFEGIGLVSTFLLVYFWWARRELRFPQALLLLPLGMMLSWTFNVLRIAGLIALGDRGWEGIAAGGFHSQAGALAFNGIALALVVISRRSPLVSRAVARGAAPSMGADRATAAYVGPLMAIALTTMITGLASDGGLDRLYAARVAAALAVLSWFRREYGGLGILGSWQAIGVGLAVFAIWTAMEPASPPASEASGALAGMSRAGVVAWLVARGIGSVAVVPLAEELAFRGYLTRRLIDADFRAVPEGRFTWRSFLIASLLFGLLHQQRWLAGTIAGMAYALIYYRRGRLIDAVTAHATTNLCITALAVWTGEWSRWS